MFLFNSICVVEGTLTSMSTFVLCYPYGYISYLSIYVSAHQYAFERLQNLHMFEGVFSSHGDVCIPSHTQIAIDVDESNGLVHQTPSCLTRYSLIEPAFSGWRSQHL